jgi:signal transduction histidine kinase
MQLEELVKERTRKLSETVQQLEIQIKEAKEKDVQLREAFEREKELGELKSKFVSLASHEFRTPLTTILSSAYLVSQYKSYDDQPKREKHIEKIVSSVNMLDDILSDFLSVGRIEEGKIKVKVTKFDVSDFINVYINQLNPILKNGQKIIQEYKGDSTVDFLDQNLFKHILMNLISNAIKFSPENSAIHLSISNFKNRLTLSVKDEGIGIPEEDIKHLFERFYRATNASNIQGTGLGLHIVAKYAELMNGTILCKSHTGKGTEFIVTFNSKLTDDANNIGN